MPDYGGILDDELLVGSEILFAPLTVELPTTARTPINKASQISFINSPVHLRLQNAAADNTLLSVVVYLWIWGGDQNTVLGKANVTFKKNKVSASDDYINIQIGDQIKSYLENPLSAPNTNQPNFYYNEVEPASITGQGVFYQVVADITSSGDTVRNNYETKFATLGYRWNYEQNLIKGNNGVAPNGSLGFAETVNKWYNPKIHNYLTQSFNFTNTVEEATSTNMILQTPVDPPAIWSRCSRDPSLIVFLNKLGLWEMFTPNGKFTASTIVDASTSNVSFRDPSRVDNSFFHSKRRGNLEVTQKYIVNTGSLTEDMSATIEEIIYSPKIYLIRFKGDLQTEERLGVTVDSTVITADDTTITVDSATIGAEDLGFFKTHQQIPVTILDSDFSRKTRVNDKNEINYNIMFEETNNKINNIR